MMILFLLQSWVIISVLWKAPAAMDRLYTFARDFNSWLKKFPEAGTHARHQWWHDDVNGSVCIKAVTSPFSPAWPSTLILSRVDFELIFVILFFTALSVQWLKWRPTTDAVQAEAGLVSLPPPPTRSHTQRVWWLFLFLMSLSSVFGGAALTLQTSHTSLPLPVLLPHSSVFVRKQAQVARVLAGRERRPARTTATLRREREP